MAEFETNLVRAQLAATWTSLCLQTAHDLFGRAYLSLSILSGWLLTRPGSRLWDPTIKR